MHYMATIFRPRTLVLFVGDIFFFTFALWLSLLVRYLELPNWEFFTLHLEPFLILFAVWVAVYFIAGLYEGRSIILARRALSSTLLWAQIVNMSIAALFFFAVPLFGIAPKTILFVYLFVSFVLILLWRAILFPRLGLQKPENALVVGERAEVLEFARVLSNSPFAPVRVAAVIKPDGASVAEEIKTALQKHRAHFIIADFSDPKISKAFPEMYNFLSHGVRFFDALALYEAVLGRIPLSSLDDRWFARNVSRYAHMLYDTVKRLMDIVGGLFLSLIPLVCYPIFALIIKLQDGGSVFYRQIRMGQNNQPFVMLKFRSMSGTDQGDEVLQSKHVVTPFGKFLRISRLDEFPQAWNVLKGDMSLVGPRPEFPALVEAYEKEIPYYGVRHLVKPGLSGWAQLYHDNHPHHGTEVEATREKLSYDLYYLKHRSITLDAIIVLKTIKKLLTRSGV
jgi:exopolysaccharide biosynthesis polyprenyl glycosylphosphotransferase